MNLPIITEYANKSNIRSYSVARVEAAIKTLEDGLNDKHIWNVDYLGAKDTLSRFYSGVVEDASQWYLKLDKRPEWGADDPRWMCWYTPDFHNTPGALKKLLKYKSTMGEGFDHFLVVLSEFAQLAEMVKAAKPFIEKGRKPSLNPVEKDVTNTGICPVCMRRQKLTLSEVGCMVAHGYTLERNWGGRNGMCFGAGYPAWELSPDGAIEHKKVMELMLANSKDYLKRLMGGHVKEFNEIVRNRDGSHEKKIHPKGTPEYAKMFDTEKWQTERNINYLTSDIKALSARIDGWKEQPLMYGGAETQPRWQSKLLNKKN